MINILPITLRDISKITRIPIILIIMIFFFLIIVDNSSLHYLKTSFELLIINLCSFCSFLLFTSSMSTLCNISIKYFPLSNLSFNCITWRRFGWCSFLSHYSILCLSFSCIIIKFISHCLFNSLNIFRGFWIFLFLISNSIIDKLFFHIP